jgi:uncharacterized protein
MLPSAMDHYDIVKNNDENRFETTVDGFTAYLEYKMKNGEMYLVHTFVPEPVRGRNIADQLASYALDYITREGLEARIYCEFIATYIKRNKKYDHFNDRISE